MDSKDIYLNVVDICSDDVNKFKDSGTRKKDRNNNIKNMG